MQVCVSKCSQVETLRRVCNQRFETLSPKGSSACSVWKRFLQRSGTQRPGLPIAWKRCLCWSETLPQRQVCTKRFETLSPKASLHKGEGISCFLFELEQACLQRRELLAIGPCQRLYGLFIHRIPVQLTRCVYTPVT